MKKYGQLISKLRKKQGLTQEQLGKKLNVSYQAVSKWENNLSEPDLDTIEKLTKVFGISISEFFELAKNPEEIDNHKTSDVNSTLQTKNFLKLKPWYLVIGLGVFVVILSLIAFLIPVKYSAKQVFSKYDSSVFFLSTENPFSPRSGTGFFINKSGLAVTTYTNIKDCTDGTIMLNNGKQHKVKKVVGVDEDNNLAIIQIDIGKSRPVRLGNSNDIQMGDKVYSITYSNNDKLDDAKSVLTEGMVYKVESNSDGTTSIQTTASTDNANKGGVLFNENGKVIGIINGQLTISGIGFDLVNVCLPINLLENVEKNINISMEEYVNNPFCLTFINPQDEIIETKTVKKGFVLEKYKKTGYVVSGLYTDKAFKKPFDLNSPIMSSQNIYVDLRPIKYTIVFNANGADGTMSSQTFYYDQVQTLNHCEFYLENKMFSHWTYNGFNYYEDAQILNITSKDNDILNFDAVWKDLQFTVTFDSNGGSGTMYSEKYLYNQTYTVPNNRFYKTGYEFSHWECDGTTYQSGQTVGRISNDKTTFVLKAVWTPINYKVMYKDSSSYTYNAGTATYDKEFVLSNCSYKNQDIDYLTYNGETYKVGDSIKNLATYNKTIYLDITWKGVDYQIKYYTDESHYVIYDYTWGVNKYLASSSSFSKTGYYCSGFISEKYNNERFSTGDYFTNTKYEILPNEVLEFKVLWSPILYTVIVDNIYISDIYIDCYYDESFVIPEMIEVREGYTLENYSLKIGGEFVRYVEKDETLINLTTNSNAKIYLIPNWTANVTTLNYYVDGALYKTETVEYDSYYHIAQYKTEKTDMWFNCWTYDSTSYYPGSYFKSRFLESEINFYDIWSIKLNGSGTEDDPYLIETFEELSSLAYLCNNYNFSYAVFKLVNDIDCENKELKAISCLNYAVFDGNNKVIKNVKLTQREKNSGIALFSAASYSTIKNLGIENFIIDYEGDQVKSFAGLLTHGYTTTIENCWVKGVIKANCFRAKDIEYIDVGGLCEYMADSSIVKNCYSLTEITVEHTNPNQVTIQYTERYIAPFGRLYKSTIENCYAITSVNSLIDSKGFISKQTNSTVTNCFYGYIEGDVEFLSDNTLLEQFEYYIQTDVNTVSSDTLQDLQDLEYLYSNLGFDKAIWQSSKENFPILTSFGEVV